MEKQKQHQVDALAQTVAHTLQQEGAGKASQPQPSRDGIFQDSQIFNETAPMAGLQKMLQHLTVLAPQSQPVPT